MCSACCRGVGKAWAASNRQGSSGPTRIYVFFSSVLHVMHECSGLEFMFAALSLCAPMLDRFASAAPCNRCHHYAEAGTVAANQIPLTLTDALEIHRLSSERCPHACFLAPSPVLDTPVHDPAPHKRADLRWTGKLGLFRAMEALADLFFLCCSRLPTATWLWLVRLSLSGLHAFAEQGCKRGDVNRAPRRYPSTQGLHAFPEHTKVCTGA